MAGRHARKRAAFFQRCADALRRLGEPEEVFICPICGLRLDRGALGAGRLTLEHVPPRSTGGRAISLTCHDCNSRGGSGPDVALAELRRMQELSRGLRGESSNFRGRGTLAVGGISQNVHLSFDDNGMRIAVPRRYNDPSSWHAVRAHVRAEATAPNDLPVSLATHFRADDGRVLVSLLRSAYLAAFAYFGYSYIAHPSLDPVRLQILSPHEPIVPRIATVWTPELSAPITAPSVGLMTGPIEGVAVLFPPGSLPITGALSVLLPWFSEGDFYAELLGGSEATPRGRMINHDVDLHGWPSRPELLLDFSR